MEHWLYTLEIAGYKLNFNLDTIFTMWFAMFCIILLAFLSTRKLSIIPNKIQAVGEGFMNFVWGLMDSMMPENNRSHVPLIASLFLFILFANLMGQLPLRIIHLKSGELASPTNDINMTAAMAVIVLIYYVTAGFIKKKHKFLLKDFSFVSIIMMLVDLLDMATRPLSLAVRLFANIFAGEILVSIALGAFAYFLPLPVMLFEILVAFIQATVFMMLTMAYVGGAIGDEH